MGRAFEFRKERKMKRWGNMAKTFTKIGREISIAVKAGGGDPEYNAKLRIAIQNAKSANMPKANIESAIKKASEKDSANYDEVIFEGYAPHGIAVLVEAATDNNKRTVANVRHHFSKYGGSMGTSGSVDYMFERKAVFTVLKTDDIDLEELELELIDYGLEEIKEDVNEKEEAILKLYADFTDFGNLQKGLEEKSIESTGASAERFPTHTKKLTDEETEAVIKLIDKMEEDDDVLNVFHTMDESE